MKSGICPSQVKDLIQFEDDLVRIAKELKFCKVNNEFQKMQREDVSHQRKHQSADIKENANQNFLKDVITTAYYKANRSTGTKIHKEGVKFANQADKLDKIEMNGTGNSFVTLKDHKENFMNHPTTRLKSPSKNEIGGISKHILVQIKTNLISKLSVNEWKSTISVISGSRILMTIDYTNFCNLK